MHNWVRDAQVSTLLNHSRMTTYKHESVNVFGGAVNLSDGVGKNTLTKNAVRGQGWGIRIHMGDTSNGRGHARPVLVELATRFRRWEATSAAGPRLSDGTVLPQPVQRRL